MVALWLHCGCKSNCRLTLRPSGLPPARRLARKALAVIIRLAGQAPSRRQPLSSNVRPHQQRALVHQQLSSAKPSSSQSHVGASRLGAVATSEVARSRRLRRCPQSLRQFLEVLAVRHKDEVAPQSIHRWRGCEHKPASSVALAVRHAGLIQALQTRDAGAFGQPELLSVKAQPPRPSTAAVRCLRCPSRHATG